MMIEYKEGDRIILTVSRFNVPIGTKGTLAEIRGTTPESYIMRLDYFNTVKFDTQHYRNEQLNKILDDV